MTRSGDVLQHEKGKEPDEPEAVVLVASSSFQ